MRKQKKKQKLSVTYECVPVRQRELSFECALRLNVMGKETKGFR